MAKWYGWAGWVLKVDLTTGSIEKEFLDWQFALKYLGGTRLRHPYLYDNVGPETDA